MWNTVTAPSHSAPSHHQSRFIHRVTFLCTPPPHMSEKVTLTSSYLLLKAFNLFSEPRGKVLILACWSSFVKPLSLPEQSMTSYGKQNTYLIGVL